MARIIDGSAMNLVGKKIKKLRKQRKMTQRELSEKLELLGVYVCRGSVSRMEERTRTVTDIELYAIIDKISFKKSANSNIDIVK